MERWNHTFGRELGLYPKLSAILVAGTIGALAIFVMPHIAAAQRGDSTGNSSNLKRKPPTALVPPAPNNKSRVANSPPAANPARAKKLPGTGSAGQPKERTDRPNDRRRVQLEPQKGVKQSAGDASNRQPQASSSNRTKQGNSSPPAAQPKRRVAASQKGQGNSGNAARNSPNAAPGIAGAAKRKAASQAASDKADDEEYSAELKARIRAADQANGLSPAALEAAQKKADLPAMDGNVVNRRGRRVDQEIVVDVLGLDPKLKDSGHDPKDLLKTAADLATVGSSSDKITEESLKNGKRNLVKSELEKQLGLLPGVVEDATGSKRPLDPEELVDKAARAALQGLPLTRGGFKDSEDLRTGRRTLEDVIANPSPDDKPPKTDDPPGGGINPDPKDSTPGNADDPLPDVKPGPTDPKDGPGDGSGDEIGNGSVGGNDPQPDIEPGPEDPNDGPGDELGDGSGAGDDPQPDIEPGPADPNDGAGDGPRDGGDSGSSTGTVVRETVTHTDDGFDLTVTNTDTGEEYTEHWTGNEQDGYTGDVDGETIAELPPESTIIYEVDEGEQQEDAAQEEQQEDTDTEEGDTDTEEDDADADGSEAEDEEDAEGDNAGVEFTPAPDSDGTVVRDPALTERLRQRQRDEMTGSHPNGTPDSNPAPDSAGGEIVVPDLLLPAEENKSLRERLINPDPNAPALPRGQVRVNPKDVVGPKAGTINPGPEGNGPEGPQPESSPPIENEADRALDDGSSPDEPHDSGSGSSANEGSGEPATTNGSSDSGRATKAIDENSASEQLRRASNRMLKLLKIKSETQPTKPKPKTTQQSPSR